jgi:hypothetical protein
MVLSYGVTCRKTTEKNKPFTTLPILLMYTPWRQELRMTTNFPSESVR